MHRQIEHLKVIGRSTSIALTAPRPSRSDDNGAVRRDVSAADGDDDARAAPLGIAVAADAEGLRYHRSLYLLCCYLIDY